MKQITVQQAFRLIDGCERIHCMSSNPVMQPSFFRVGWHKEYSSAAEAIQTADRLFLLSEEDAFLSHWLLCVNTKGKYPEAQVFMKTK